MEIFEDFTVDKSDNKGYMMIKKREFNPELSAFSNLLLDLADFKDRIRPMANDMALLDVTKKYQRKPAAEILEERADYLNALNRDQSAATPG